MNVCVKSSIKRLKFCILGNDSLHLVHVGDGGGVQQLVGDLLDGGAGRSVHTLHGHGRGPALVDGLQTCYRC